MMGVRQERELYERDVTRYEHALLHCPDRSCHTVVPSCIEARESFDTGDAHRKAIIDVATGVAAPLLLDYVAATLRSSQLLGVERLYFLARDGQALYRIAGVLETLLRTGIDFRYLEASRTTLCLAASRSYSDETHSALLPRMHRLSSDEVSQRLRISLDELSRHVSLPRRRTESLGMDRAQRLAKALETTPLRARLLDESSKLRERTIPFLEEVGFFDNLRIGVVDLGGAGSQLRALGLLRMERRLSRPVGFLFSRDADRSFGGRCRWNDDRCGCAPLLVHSRDEVAGIGPARFTAMLTLMEVFCSADHGRVNDYRPSSDGSWCAVTDLRPSSELQDWGFTELRAAIDAVVGSVARDGVLPDHLSSCALKNHRRFVLEPTIGEASAWGAFPVGPHDKLVSPLTMRSLARTLRRGEIVPEARRWWPASRIQSPLPVRACVAALTRVRRRL